MSLFEFAWVRLVARPRQLISYIIEIQTPWFSARKQRRLIDLPACLPTGSIFSLSASRLSQLPAFFVILRLFTRMKILHFVGRDDACIAIAPVRCISNEYLHQKNFLIQGLHNSFSQSEPLWPCAFVSTHDCHPYAIVIVYTSSFILTKISIFCNIFESLTLLKFGNSAMLSTRISPAYSVLILTFLWRSTLHVPPPVPVV